MTTNNVTTYPTFAEFFAEVHHERGNFTKFESFNPNTNTWEEIDVWDYRKVSTDDPSQALWWRIGWDMYENLPPLRLEDDTIVEKPLRVTRYPVLEADVADAPYHPSVPSWKIDPEKIEEFLSAGIARN